jgi:hypothetical protein
MRKTQTIANANNCAERRARPLRLPGFVSDEQIGLGDLIKRTTSYLGVAACGECARRAEVLNSWLVLGGRRTE